MNDNIIEPIPRCLRCSKILTSKKSIKRGYGRECFIITQSENNIINKDEIKIDIDFLKCEVGFLKRQLKEIRSSEFVYSGSKLSLIHI